MWNRSYAKESQNVLPVTIRKNVKRMRNEMQKMSQDNEYQFNGKKKVLEGMATLWHVWCTRTS